MNTKCFETGDRTAARMGRSIFIVLVAFMLLFGCRNAQQSADPSRPVVEITGGQVQGLALDEGGATFKGLPYAAPPVGDLRWHEPQPVVPWKGIRDAVEYCAPCAQIAAGWNDNSATISSEDCLFVNVWTPNLNPSEKLPVMVWIHGGGNTGGSSLGLGGIEPSFDGEDLSRNGVVVVSLNYRLGILGFLAHPELTAESENNSSGNYGLLDQIAALKWVQDNIEVFGGNPDNVTIFGQSAGAQDVSLLLTSPLAKDLFHKAIAESGSVIIGGRLTPSLANMEATGIVLAKAMNAPDNKAIEFMRSLPVDEVLAASPEYGSRLNRPEPNADGYVIPALPALIFKQIEESPIPMILGNNARERGLSEDQDAATAIREFYGPLADRALSFYNLASEGKGETYAPYGDIGSQFNTDIMFRCSSLLEAQWHSAKAVTYYYEFAHGYEPLGAAHSWELQYVFGNLRPEASEEADSSISKQIQQYWTNFAKTGNPNDGILPQWPLFGSNRTYLEFIDKGPVAKSNLRGEVFDLFSEKINTDITTLLNED